MEMEDSQAERHCTRAVFLDRDGVINRHRADYVKSINEFELLSDVAVNLSNIRNLGFRIIIITNQSAVNRKLISEDDLNTIHRSLISRLKHTDCIIDDILYCPHKPEERCSCRKPAIGLFLQAKAKHRIKLTDSWMIGDSEIDIEAGRKAGCKTIKIDRNGTLKKAYEIIRSHS